MPLPSAVTSAIGLPLPSVRITVLGDGQVVALVSQVIVTADQTQATLLNRIVAYVFAGSTGTTSPGTDFGAGGELGGSTGTTSPGTDFGAGGVGSASP